MRTTGTVRTLSVLSVVAIRCAENFKEFETDPDLAKFSAIDACFCI